MSAKVAIACLALVIAVANPILVEGLVSIQERPSSTRRIWLTTQVPSLMAAAAAATIVLPDSATAASAPAPDLKFIETASGLSYADAKVGTGQPVTDKGSSVTIDYVMSTTGARYGSKIYSTKDTDAPYRFRLGDGTTIQGIELAIAGGNGIEPMRPGGIRRVVIPASLGYQSLAEPLSGLQYENCQQGKGVGPIPPTDQGTTAEYFQRFKNIYCNANRPYQPDLVMDIKLYGKR
ncbi:Peptidyl-prolyl cis-trans isomerase [Seminavis robusta]|uniref:peptidylprolyl isomerase n=1 Tax=Seminavis robusta TaxID=568900 RepID=A0A9N8HJP2_9STRA|nr:Peptidyl-prolyl cis-trans isomerase [Seminavis robusta]|eukprot:Sro779_g201310.1 Peptidyl-prolyl cis-trans isomerase (235) ;mRNA; f:26867-27571